MKLYLKYLSTLLVFICSLGWHIAMASTPSQPPKPEFAWPQGPEWNYGVDAIQLQCGDLSRHDGLEGDFYAHFIKETSKDGTKKSFGAFMSYLKPSNEIPDNIYCGVDEAKIVGGNLVLANYFGDPYNEQCEVTINAKGKMSSMGYPLYDVHFIYHIHSGTVLTYNEKRKLTDCILTSSPQTIVDEFNKKWF